MLHIQMHEIVILLIEKGAYINIQDKFSRTLLMVAILYNRDNYDMILYFVIIAQSPILRFPQEFLAETDVLYYRYAGYYQEKQFRLRIVKEDISKYE